MAQSTPLTTTNKVYMVLVLDRQSDLLGMFDSIIGHRNQYANLVLAMTTSESRIDLDIYKYPNHRRAHPDY